MEDSTLDSLALWRHQHKAIKLAQKYLQASFGQNTDQSALIRMPTGTGKSGIIAILSHLLYTSQTPLIVAPSTALRDQLDGKIESDFWEVADEYGEVDTPVKTQTFTPSSLDDAVEASNEGAAILCTAQTLEMLHRPVRTGTGNRKRYKRLREAVDYLLFDEGHREPSPKWAQACQGLRCPIVLFSATPYRNDFSLFNVDNEFTYSYRFQNARSDNYVRRVDFVDLDFDSVDDFSNQLVDFYENQLEERKPESVDEPRVIVRCDSMANVRRVTESLRSQDVDAIGIHHRLDVDDLEYARQSVPNPKNEDAKFWAHQYKLIEGIDDPSFCLVAIFDDLSNARSLVQQVGRIVRNPSRSPDESAIVLTDEESNQKEFWNKYLVFERSTSDDDIDLRNLPVAFLQDQPDARYLDGDYRTKFDPSASNIYKSIKYPRRANVLELESKQWNVDILLNDVAEEWSSTDRVVLSKEFPDDDTFVVTYVVIRNSPILLDSYFVELNLGFTICRREKGLLFYYDSEQYLSEQVRSISEVVNPEQFSRLFKSGGRATSVSLRNTDLGQSAPRRRALHAHSIQDIAPGLVDHAYFPSTVRARISEDDESDVENVSRYLGLTSGRLSERAPSGYDYTYSDYVEWVSRRASALMGQSATRNELMQRYASYVEPPPDCQAEHILLDVEDILYDEEFEHSETNEDLSLHSLAHEIEDNKFTVCANDREYEIEVSYDAEDKKYTLHSERLNSDFTQPPEYSPQRGLVDYINVEQAFRIVPNADTSDAQIIYANGNFYSPTRSLGGDLNLSQLFCPIMELGEVTSEKGTGGDSPEDVQDGWPDGSMFNLIDQNGVANGSPEDDGEFHERLSEMDIVICDDMGREVADFILADTSKQFVAFAHVKHNDLQLSASAFQDVCAQATKNLDYITPSSNANPKNSWSKSWKSNGYEVNDRIRRGYTVSDKVSEEEDTVDPIWNDVKEIVRNPSAQREVWIVFGGGFRLSRFEEKFSNQVARAVQLHYLIQSTWAAVSSAGASLRIYCPDHDDENE